MIKAVIVEDEGVASRRLSKLLKEESIEILKVFKSNEELSAYLQGEERPDLFFMDIHLNDGVVFDTLQKHVVNTPIIFTTAYDQYAIKAFKLQSIDYLLKPIDKEELSVSIQKFKSIYKNHEAVDILALTKLINASKNNYRERIKVKIGDRFRSFKVGDLSMLFSDSKITFICSEEGRAYPIDQSLESITESLDPSIFHRVNRSQIVNIDFISEVLAFSNSRLKVVIIGSEDREIIVARERVKNFKEWLG